MPAFQAEWLLPISERPIHRGVLTVDDRGRIRDVGAADAVGARDLGRVAVLPALVNAHTHLELSYLRGRILPAPGFGQWVGGVMAARRQFPDPSDPQIITPAREAVRAMRRSGTGLVGDVSNTLVTADLLREAAMPAHVFYELTGFTETDPTGRVAVQMRRRGTAFV